MSLLVSLLVLLVVCAFVSWLIGVLPLPQLAKTISYGVLAFLAVFYALDLFGVVKLGIFHK